MKIIRRLLVAVAILITVLVGGVVAANIYRRLKYPHVAVEGTDVFFDIGLVFFFGFTTVLALAVVAWVLQVRKRRAAPDAGRSDEWQ